MAALFSLLALLLTTVVAQPTVVKICVPYETTGSLLNRCTKAVGIANNEDLEFECVAGGSADECMEQLAEEESHLTTLDGSDVIRAHAEYSLQPLIAENTDDDVQSGVYYAVAVVNKDFCGKDTTLDNLFGVRSCHTGFRKSAGWKIPVGTLLSEVEGFKTEGTDGLVEDDAELVASFFDSVCAPRVSGNGPIITEDGEGALWDKLCEGCKGDCTTNDQYYDYSGALRCLMEDGGDVAFVKHTTVLEYAADGTADEVLRAWATKNASDFKLLCREGGCADVEEYKDCHLAVAPAHALVTTESLGFGGDDEKTGVAIRSAILLAAEDDDFLNQTIGLTSNFLWSSSTKSLEPIEEGMDGYIQKDSLDTFSAFDKVAEANSKDIPPTAIYCASSDEEFEFCDKMVEAVVDMAPDFVWDCTQKNSTDECVHAIAQGEADWMTGSPRQAHSAFLRYGLTVIASEQGEVGNGTDYYSVAVIKAEFCEDNEDARLIDLRGKKSCHTGFRRNAGWDVPVGRMVQLGIMELAAEDDSVDNDAETVGAFFESSCAPSRDGEGPKTTESGQKRTWKPLCSVCKKGCDADSDYFGYEGAHQCLKDDAGDVAFVKHSTPLDLATKKEQAKLKLLCPARSGCADLEDYEECNLGAVPARAVIVKDTPMYTRKFKEALVNISQEEDFADLVLNKEANPEGFIFRGTEGLIPLEGDVEAYLGDALDSYSALDALETPEGTTVNVCIPYEATPAVVAKCDGLFKMANISGIDIRCVAGGSASACMEHIFKGESHLTALDGGDVFTAHHVYGMVPLIKEVGKDDVEGTYYAVAVVNSDFCEDDTSLASLKGQRSCHTGYRKMAGWRIPVGTLYSEVESFSAKTKRAVIEDDAELVAKFFDSVCAPRVSGNGPKNGEDGEGELWKDLCEGCKGDCTTNDQYYDYSGALRCLMEDGGDVAFVKHTTVLEYAADGTADEVLRAWATKNASDFKLLCREGGCADVEEYKDCHLALVPSHAIVGAAALGETGSLARLGGIIQDGLIQASKDKAFFDEAKGFIKDFPFSSSTKSLIKVEGGHDGYITPEADETLNAFSELIGGETRSNSGSSATFCATTPEQFEACEANVENIFKTIEPDWEWGCREEASVEACVKSIKAGTSQFMAAAPGDALHAHDSHGLSAIAAESVDDVPVVYSIGFIKSENCENTTYITSYKDKNVCFSNYGGDAGWVIPVGVMINQGLLEQYEEVEAPTHSGHADQGIVDYFKDVCAPHNLDHEHFHVIGESDREDHEHGKHDHGDEEEKEDGDGHSDEEKEDGDGHGDEEKEDDHDGHGHGDEEKEDDHDGHGHGDEEKEDDHDGHGHGDEEKEDGDGHGDEEKEDGDGHGDEDEELTGHGDDLCLGCPDGCRHDQDYFGPLGALECVKDEKDAIGFTDTSIFLTKGSTKGFSLVCPFKRGCHDPSGYRTCNWGETPTDMIMVRSDMAPVYLSALTAHLIAASSADGYESMLGQNRADGRLIALIGNTGLHLSDYASTKRIFDSFNES